jgi:hypothetical protein
MSKAHAIGQHDRAACYSMPVIASLIEHINQAHHTTFRLERRYALGEQGAYALQDATGASFVLKRYAGDQHAQLVQVRDTTERLRQQGYPAPHYLLLGRSQAGSYAIQTALPGAPLEAPTPAQLASLIELNRLQAGQAAGEPSIWPEQVIAPVLYGGAGFCLLDAMPAYSAEASELLARIQALVRGHADAGLPTGDIVHYDFNPANILTAEGTITGVVDWEAVCAGDRAFDLATLLFYCYDAEEARPLLRHALDQVAGPAAATIYLAHLAHRQVDWSIRHHDSATIARWMRVVQAVLAEQEQASR